MAECAAIILAAGQAARYRAAGGMEASKLVADVGGMPMVRHVAIAALASTARPVLVVTGHAQREVASALVGLAVQLVHNPDFVTGMASSLKAGVAALPLGAPGAVILLADMPSVQAALIDRLAQALASRADAIAAVPVFAGKRGNPVALAASLFAAVGKLSGDEGARKLLTDAARVVEVAVEDACVTLDIDTPEALTALRDRSG